MTLAIDFAELVNEMELACTFKRRTYCGQEKEGREEKGSQEGC